MEYRQAAENLLDFISRATSPVQTVQAAKEQLLAAGFEYLEPDRYWNLEINGAYVTVLYDSTLVAFTVGEQFPDTGKLRIAAAHTDFPGFCVKPNCEWKENGYVKLNVEPYGGVILPTWLDRPLSLSGKVIVKGQEPFESLVKYVDIRRPVMTMPNLAIHLNREMNEKASYDRQVDMQPLCDAVSAELSGDGYFLDFLAEECGIEKEDILDFELYLYVAEKGDILGFHDSLISSPRLDNLTSVQACLRGIMDAGGSEDLQIIALFDHEEIGSRTKQGAGSVLLQMILEKIYTTFGMGRVDMIDGVLSGRMLSVDVAHAVHPNRPGKYDPTNRAWLNRGIVLKTACSQSYVCDAEMMAGVVQLCEAEGIAYQKFANRSSERGGGTLGSIASVMVPMRALDIGVPVLAMHSARETMGVKDQAYLEELLVQFFSR